MWAFTSSSIRCGEARFASLWSALEDLTGRADPLPETDDLRRRATGGE
jgi:hypothetical protein